MTKVATCFGIVFLMSLLLLGCDVLELTDDISGDDRCSVTTTFEAQCVRRADAIRDSCVARAVSNSEIDECLQERRESVNCCELTPCCRDNECNKCFFE